MSTAPLRRRWRQHPTLDTVYQSMILTSDLSSSISQLTVTLLWKLHLHLSLSLIVHPEHL